MNELYNKLGYCDYFLYDDANGMISIGLSGCGTIRAVWSYMYELYE